MSAAAKLKLTPQEYLEIERKAATRSEFYDGEIFAVAGARREHNATNENLSVEVALRLKGGNCRTFSRDLRVLVARTGLYTYPDLIIVCGKEEYVPDDQFDTLLNPQILFEVLSPSTEKYDRGMKFLHYQRIESLKEYVLVAQETPLIERFVKQPDGSWAQTVFMNMDAIFELATLPVTIPFAEIYRDVRFVYPDPLTPDKPSANG